jgi:predicted RNA-binding Zn ribbon-like protein
LLVKAPLPKPTEYCWRPLEANALLRACSLAVERLSADTDRSKVRKCGASDCNVFYLDHGKGYQRQWCSMKDCRNREIKATASRLTKE